MNTHPKQGGQRGRVTPKEKQDSQPCSSCPVVAFPLLFPSPHTPSGPGTTCTRCRTRISFQSPEHRISAAGPPPPVHIAATHPSSASTPRPRSWAQSTQPEMGAVSAITVGFTTSYYCSFTVYLLCVPTYVDACSVPVDIRASMCHVTYLLKHRGMSDL